jgi:hypothetical protein
LAPIPIDNRVLAEYPVSAGLRLRVVAAVVVSQLVVKLVLLPNVQLSKSFSMDPRFPLSKSFLLEAPLF